MALFGKSSPRDDAKAAAYRDWLRQRHPLAVASFVLGIFSLIEFGAIIVFGIAGVVCGVIALRQLALPPRPSADGTAPPTSGHRLAWAGIAISAVSLAFAAVLYLMPGRR